MPENTNIAKDMGKLFLPKDADALFKIDNMVAFNAKANTSAQVEITTAQDQKRGGQANAVIGVVTSEKSVSVTFTTPEWQPEFLAANIGTTIRFGQKNFYIDNLTFTPDNTGKITLPAIPADKKVQVEINGKWLSIDATTTTVDLSGYGVTETDCIKTIILLPKDGKEISLLVDTDPSIGELILTSPIFRGTKGQVGTAQYTFPSFALSGNWTQVFSTDASYDISGTAIAIAGEYCGESETYGYYREYISDDDVAYVGIAAAPSAVELEVGDTQQISVYGIRGALYDKTLLDTGVTFAVVEGGSTYVSVSNAGLITALAAGEATVKATYGTFTANVAVTVTAAGE